MDGKKLQDRNDAAAAPVPPPQLPAGRKPMREAISAAHVNSNKGGMNTGEWSDTVGADGGADAYGLLGLLGVIRMTNPDRSMLALGSDLTTLGLDLNTAESVTL